MRSAVADERHGPLLAEEVRDAIPGHAKQPGARLFHGLEEAIGGDEFVEDLLQDVFRFALIGHAAANEIREARAIAGKSVEDAAVVGFAGRAGGGRVRVRRGEAAAAAIRKRDGIGSQKLCLLFAPQARLTGDVAAPDNTQTAGPRGLAVRLGTTTVDESGQQIFLVFPLLSLSRMMQIERQGTKVRCRCLTWQSTPRQTRLAICCAPEAFGHTDARRIRNRLWPGGGTAMFSELVESVARPRGKRKGWAVIGSAALQATCLLVLIIVPLIYTQALPKAILNTLLVVPAAPAPQPPAQPRAASTARAARLLRGKTLTEPPRIPPTVKIFDEAPLPPETPVQDGIPGGDSGFNLLNVAPDSARPVSPPAAAPAARQRVPVTSTIEAAKLILRVQPVYPPLAIQSRIQGNVVLHAIIGKDGEVTELQVLSGHPLLVKAALDAVRQWRYSPTLLSGQPVEVETTITVSFVLGQ